MVSQMRLAVLARLLVGQRRHSDGNRISDCLKAVSRKEKKRSMYQLAQILEIGIDIDREIEEVGDVGNAAAVARRPAGLQHVEALDDQDVGLIDD